MNASNDLPASAQTSFHAVLQVCDRGSGDVLVLAPHLLDEFCMDCHPGFSVVLRVALHAERF